MYMYMRDLGSIQPINIDSNASVTDRDQSD